MSEEHPNLEGPHTLACSFCRKRLNEVLKLIAGPGVSICNECVQLCQEILLEDGVPPPTARVRQRSWFARLVRRG